MKTSYALPLIFLAMTACGESETATRDAATAIDSSTPTDAGVAAGDAGRVVDEGVEPAALHDCRESDFVDLTAAPADARMIMVPRGTFTFDNPCMTIRAGQAVMFMWDFSTHPLVAGVAPGHAGVGTEPNPIVAQSSGTLYEQAFAAAGEYPYYCDMHFHSGMMGVVRVVP